MGSPDLLDRLRQHKSLGAVPGEELAWLVAHRTPRSFHVGDVTTRKSQPEEWLHIALTGRVAIHVDRGAGSRKIIEWRGGDVFGLMHYSRGGAPPGDTIVEEPTETLAIHRELLPVMIRECPGITARLVHAMLDRARDFTSSDLHDEKLVSLGKFAAGLAHELNNPASAAARSTQLLVNGLAGAEQAAMGLAAARLSAAQLAAIDSVRELCRRESTPLSRSRLRWRRPASRPRRSSRSPSCFLRMLWMPRFTGWPPFGWFARRLPKSRRPPRESMSSSRRSKGSRTWIIFLHRKRWT